MCFRFLFFCTCCLHFTTVWWYFVVTDASSSWRNDFFPIQCPALVENIKHLDVLGVAHYCVREHPTTLPPTPAAHFITLPPVVSSCLLGLKVQTTQNHTQPCNTHSCVYVVCSSFHYGLLWRCKVLHCLSFANASIESYFNSWLGCSSCGVSHARCRVWHTRNRLMLTSTSFIDNTDNVMLLQHWFHLLRSHRVWVEF